MQAARLPLGLLRIRVQKEGFETFDYVKDTTFDPDNVFGSSLELVEEGSATPGAVRVPAQ